MGLCCLFAFGHESKSKILSLSTYTHSPSSRLNVSERVIILTGYACCGNDTPIRYCCDSVTVAAIITCICNVYIAYETALQVHTVFLALSLSPCMRKSRVFELNDDDDECRKKQHTPFSLWNSTFYVKFVLVFTLMRACYVYSERIFSSSFTLFSLSLLLPMLLVLVHMIPDHFSTWNLIWYIDDFFEGKKRNHLEGTTFNSCACNFECSSSCLFGEQHKNFTTEGENNL